MELGPNGLPYARCPPALNEWCKSSPFLAQLPADTVRSMHPAIVCRPRNDVGGGMGLFCSNGIAKGDVVWAELKEAGRDENEESLAARIAVPRTRKWIEALPPASKKAYCHFMYKTDDDEFQSLAEFNCMPVDEYPNARTVDIANYMNHSCSPTCLFVDGGDEYEGLMVAARDLVPGDEVTFDYCTSEDCDGLSPEFECRCGTVNCRGKVTSRDWQLQSVQQQYAGHFMPHIVEKIARVNPSVEVAPLVKADVSQSWWLANLSGSAEGPIPKLMASAAGRPDRLELIEHVASGLWLDLLNRQAAMLIVHHRLKISKNEDLGGFVEAGAAIGAGELVMMLLPRSDCL